MRILTVGTMYPPQHLGGYELVWQGAVRALRAAGHEVDVLTTDVSFRPGAVEEDPGVTRALRWYWRDHGWPRFSARERLRLERHNARVIQRFAPDVVAWWAMGGLSLGLLAQVRAPSVAFVHDDWLLYGPQVDAWTRAWARRPRLAAFAATVTGQPTRFAPDAVDEWIFVSEHTRTKALARVALDHTSVAPSGIEATLLGPGPPRDWSGRLLVIGRIDERKGVDTAIEALARLPEPATLTIAGTGDAGHEAALRTLARERGVDGRVRWVGAVERLALSALLDDHDAVLFGVRWDEPWGLVPLEAMARGRPVVATGTGGSAEFLRDGENCLLAAVDDPFAFAAAVGRLAADAALRARLAEGGLRTAAENTDARFHAAVLAAVERVRRVRQRDA